ncbi:MAG: penicillin acylase family protein, partial [Myxococcota bacterium]|nr:penicillin acylase family protein [Myxococcota bacterium]
MGRDDEVGWGSNAWAVNGAVSADGSTLVAGDGHLPLTVPSLFYSVGLDTRELGGGDLRQVGLTIPGLPFMAVGTNGNVAWSQTQLGGDITDWYREELRLDAAGAPTASFFGGVWQDLVAQEESVEVADVPLLGSVGRTETWTRYTTFDGRFIVEIEGTTVGEDHEPADDETVVVLSGDHIVPGDIDGDGVVSAVSFDYAGFEAGHLLQALDGMGTAEDIEAYRQATRHLVAYSQSLAAGDKHGSILYTGFQALPCRTYLARDESGAFAEGADPTLLIDGTTYGGFEIPVDAEGFPIEGEADPYRCVIPFEEYPQSMDPASGFVQTANNDPVGTSFDDNLFNDPWYIGGPWEGGFRASRISSELSRMVAAGTADEQAMADLQADVKSLHGCLFGPHLIESIDAGREAFEASPAPGTADHRLGQLYADDRERLDEARSRLQAWVDSDCPALSGVETFYNPSVDGTEVAHSVATTIFNAWEGRFMSRVFDDEGLPGVWRGGGRTGRTRAGGTGRTAAWAACGSPSPRRCSTASSGSFHTWACTAAGWVA